jgi:spore germination cell wall hydrolase CwlJ-like protein
MAILEILLMAFTIFCEASSESLSGKIAVASVIHNRATDKDYLTVLLQPRQFSCYDSADEVMKHIARFELQPFLQCLVIADQIHSGKIKPVVSGKWYVKKGIKRSWMKSMKVEKVIGNHKFLMELK